MSVLGIDQGAYLLSKSILEGSTFYLDTNVLIAGLIPENRHHGAFRELSGACKALNIDLIVTQETVTELRATIALHARLLKAVGRGAF